MGATAVFETAAEIPPARKSFAKLIGSFPFPDILDIDLGVTQQANSYKGVVKARSRLKLN